MGHVPPHSSTPAPHPRSRGGGRIDVRPTNLATRPLRLPAQARSNERGTNGLLDNSVIPLVPTLRVGTCFPPLCGACRSGANNFRRTLRCASGSSRPRREASKTVFPHSEWEPGEKTRCLVRDSSQTGWRSRSGFPGNDGMRDCRNDAVSGGRHFARSLESRLICSTGLPGCILPGCLGCDRCTEFSTKSVTVICVEFQGYVLATSPRLRDSGSVLLFLLKMAGNFP